MVENGVDADLVAVRAAPADGATRTATAAATAVAERPAPPRPPPPPASVLLSAGRPVTSDVRGNLGVPSVVTDERVADWLTDRWQAASDMGGTPIPGPHWLEVDLGGPALLERILLDWEAAFATQWTLSARIAPGDAWAALARGTDARETARDARHVVQEAALAAGARGRFVRLDIEAPATQWGASLWRLQVWGTREDSAHAPAPAFAPAPAGGG